MTWSEDSPGPVTAPQVRHHKTVNTTSQTSSESFAGTVSGFLDFDFATFEIVPVLSTVGT